jgi:hypothetical protein
MKTAPGIPGGGFFTGWMHAFSAKKHEQNPTI